MDENLPLEPFPCESVPMAIHILELARQRGLRASYHPSGGTDDAHDHRITHTVWISGEPQKVRFFVRDFTSDSFP